MRIRLNGVELESRLVEGREWFVGIDVMRALGFEDPNSSLSRVVSRHFAQFVESGHARKYEVGRVGYWFFSLTGVFLVVMYSWVRNDPRVLDELVASIVEGVHNVEAAVSVDN